MVKPGVRLKGNDLWPRCHDALNPSCDCFFRCYERTDGVHTEIILRIARAGTVDECVTPGNGIS